MGGHPDRVWPVLGRVPTDAVNFGIDPLLSSVTLS